MVLVRVHGDRSHERRKNIAFVMVMLVHAVQSAMPTLDCPHLNSCETYYSNFVSSVISLVGQVASEASIVN